MKNFHSAKKMRKIEINICQYCKWSNLHTCTDRSCEEAILAAEKVGEQMNRLTYKNPNGTWGMNNGYDMSKVPSELYGALYKLKDYEETGLSPEQIIQLDEIYLEKCEEINKLKKEIKEKEEEFTIDTNVRNKDGWISVEERLPDNNGPVLCWVKSTTIASGETYIIGSCSNKCWFLQTYEIGHHHFPVKDYEVAAWQPLPEPYKAEGE